MAGAAMSGATFGRYELRRLLGVGGMGEVYEALDTSKDRVVALKMLNRELATDPVYVQRFRRESQAMARVQEPHVIPVHDWGEVDGVLYIDMRLVRGADLKERLQHHGRLTPGETVQVVEQIAAALDAAHAVGLVHRDVKPANILLTANLFAYLVDFGIAHVASDPQLTSAGSAVGSMAYMAPERFTDVPMTPAVDTYALTCVLYEALVGRVPFPVHSLAGAIGSHQMAPPPRPGAADPALSAFDAVVERGMAKDPAQRYLSPTALARAARAALTQAERDAPATVPGPRVTPAPVITPPDRPATGQQTRETGPHNSAESPAVGPESSSHQSNAGPSPAAPGAAGGTGSYPPGFPAVGSQTGNRSQSAEPGAVGGRQARVSGPPQPPAAARPVMSKTARVTGPQHPRVDATRPAAGATARVTGPQPPSGPGYPHPSAPALSKRSSSTPVLAGALGALIVIAVVGAAVWIMLSINGSRQEVAHSPPLGPSIVPPPVVVTVSQEVPTAVVPPSTAPAVYPATEQAATPTTVPPLQSTVSGADGQGFYTGGPRCNDNDAAMTIARTTASRVVICHTGVGRYYYKGARASDGARIELDDPVPNGAGAFTATNPTDGTQYQISSAGLTITQGGAVLASEPVTEFAHR
ncbi:protein kinase [Nocardia halotolerans]|uniref:non-specific serine/threonine protein kinase n=1 Tax=Nocardia halotolerans TaxID=1755878 RepID=A0ABV8VLU4_9NOCA